MFRNVIEILQNRNGPEINQNFAYFISYKALFDLAARISQCLRVLKSVSPSNKCANCDFSCWAPILGFLQFYSIEKAGQWLGRASQALPWSRRKKCGIRYKFQGENHRSSGATFTGMKTTKFWKHYVPRGFRTCAIRGRTLKIVHLGPPFLDPLYFKSLHTCTGFKPILKTFLDMEREGRWNRWSFQTFWRGWRNPSLQFLRLACRNRLFYL